jgi:hypothetical protein
MSLRELLEMESLPASCTIGDWLRRMREDTTGLSGLGKVNHHLVKQVILKDQRNGYTLDVDASIIASEKEQAKVTYKGEKGYQPQMGFLSEAGLIITGFLVLSEGAIFSFDQKLASEWLGMWLKVIHYAAFSEQRW